MRLFEIMAATAIALGVCSGVHAACATPDAPPRSTDPLSRRFATLLVEDRFSDVPKAIAGWSALVGDAAAEPNAPPEVLIRSLGWLAFSQSYVGRQEEAHATIDRGAKLMVEHRLTAASWASDIYNILGMIQVDSGEIAASFVSTAKALAIANAEAPESGAASFAHNGYANTLYAQARYAEAAREYGVATDLAVRCLAPSNGFVVNQMASYAGVLYMLGQSQEALAQNERAANWALANLAESNPVVTLALGNLGVMLRSAGRYAEAEAALSRVVDLEAKYQHDSWYYRAISLTNFASVIDQEGRHEEAEALFLKSSQWHLNAPLKRDPAMRAYPLRFSADSAEARGALDLALDRRRRAVALMESEAAADHPELARARIELGLTLALLGRAPEALGQATSAAEIVRQKLGPDDTKRMTAEVSYARIVAAANGPEAGYRLIAPIAAKLEARLLDSATSRGDLIRYAPAFSASFATVTELALATGRAEQAFHALQLANLSDIVLVNAEVAARTAAADSAAARPLKLLQDSVRNRQALDRARTFASSSTDLSELARINAAIRENDGHIADAVRTLDLVFPAYRRLSRPMPLSLVAVQHQLRRGEALVAPLPCDDGTLAILVTADGFHWRKTPAPRARIVALVGRVQASIAQARTAIDAPPPFDKAAARELYAALLPPAFAPLLSKHRDLLYYSSGALAATTPALLMAPNGRWLVRDHSLAVLPTLALDAERPVVASHRFLGVGAPLLAASEAPSKSPRFRGGAIDAVAIADFAALPHAEQELRHMADLLGGESRLLIGGDATEQRLRDLSGKGFDVVAFATHAVGSGAVAGLTEPALILTPSNPAAPADDGLLTASEVAGLYLGADWVILSACDTAAGNGAGAPPLSGLASAFIQGGARTLLVSHWPVRDDAAEALTVATVRAAGRGMPRARALQQAMLTVMGNRLMPGAGHPAIWAPFVLIGR